MTECPPISVIHGLSTGALTTEERVQVQDHVAGCERCQSLRDDSLFRELRAARRRTPTNETGPLVVAGYDIMEEIHRGGQGVVFRAAQQATKRTVALKVLLQGVHATERQRLRFEREVDLAAQLNHPNIVRIYEGGFSDGQPYYSMEHIVGRRLDVHCRNARLSTRQKLELFRVCCAAIGYAHRRGVIHRDLKPGNILIDDDGQPHVLDFGLAKLRTTRPDDPTLTHSGEFLGTLAYAAPEQTRGDSELIDTRTDVYALGVIVYQLLTEKFPYPIEGPLAETLANIESRTPDLPNVDFDLATIVLKALSKEPGRRYESAEHFGRDIENYLSGQAIDARRDSRWYLLRTSLRRNRAVAATATGFVVVLLAALIVSLAFWRRAAGDRDLAREAEGNEQQARRAEAMERDRAEHESYGANLAAAVAALEANDVSDARLRFERATERLRQWEWHFLRRRLDVSRRTLEGHSSYVEAVEFLPQSRRLASASWDRSAQIWDLDSGKAIASFRAPAELRALAVHPDGERIALGGWDGVVRIWNWKSDRLERELRGPAPRIWKVAFNGDGSRLLARFARDNNRQTGAAVVFDVTSGQTIATLTPERGMADVLMHPDGTRLIVSGQTGVSQWTITSTPTLAKESWPVEAAGLIAIDSSGAHVACCLPGQCVALIDAVSGKVRHELRGHQQHVTALAFSPDGSRLVTASRDKTIRLWDCESGSEIGLWCGHTWTVSTVAFSPDGQWIASGSWDQTMKLWRGRGDGAVPLPGSHAGRTIAVAVNPKRPTIASGGRDGRVIVREVGSSSKALWSATHDGPVQSVIFSPNGSLLATAAWDKTVRIWDAQSGAPRGVLSGHEDRVHGVAFSNDGARLFSSSRDNTIRAWDVASGKILHVLRGHTDHVHGVVVSPDGRWLASAGHLSLKIWDASTYRELHSFARRIVQEDFSLAFHPNSRWVAAGSDERTLTIWDVEEHRVVSHLRGHSDEIHCVAFNGDGSRLVSTSFDRTLRIWDFSQFREIAKLAHGKTRIDCVAFSTDGFELIVGYDDGLVAAWPGRPAPPE